MITTVIFDLGGVLIDWNPKYMYSKIFADDSHTEEFLATICTSDWNEEQDGGRSIEEATNMLIKQYPEHEQNIRAYYQRWEEMLGGVIQGTVDILADLKKNDKLRIYALTNWSAETFPIALAKYEFLHWFDGIVVSGVERKRKPFSEFYHLLLDRYKVKADEALFIDDNLRNINAASDIGLDVIHFTSPNQLKSELEKRDIIK